jgi:hypothetical protein
MKSISPALLFVVINVVTIVNAVVVSEQAHDGGLARIAKGLEKRDTSIRCRTYEYCVEEYGETWGCHVQSHRCESLSDN